MALHFACSHAQDGVIAFYVHSPQDLKAHDVSNARINFQWRNLAALQQELKELNIPLRLLDAPIRAKIPELILEFAEQHHIDALFFNQQYELDEAKRDLQVEKLLKKAGIKVNQYSDQVIIAPGNVVTPQQAFYTVFTPFKKRWLVQVESEGSQQVLPRPNAQKPLKIRSSNLPLPQNESNKMRDYWPDGERHAQQRLQHFIDSGIANYDNTRDYPALSCTSQLSPYLAAGVISIRQCFSAAKKANANSFELTTNGPSMWINELIWREFYKHIIYAFPQVCRYQPFKEKLNIRWRTNHDDFSRWCEGKTGFPLVDAAMRQLQDIGWMHNRLRMVVAMFLSKNLLISPQMGEKFFMQSLIDGDLAANNGGWQWACGTGADSAPYFRIFNPVTQSERFDAEGNFIRHYCPELATIPTESIHFPTPMERLAVGYEEAMVEIASSRERYLAMCKRNKNN